MKKDVLGVMLVMIMVCCTILSGCGKNAATENTVKNGSTQNEIETEYNNTTETESADTENTDTKNTDTENTDTKNTDTENTNTENTNTGYEIPTEYDMEEYADGYIIVSKTDHLLYGVIDIDGREVIPVEYDNIDFVRRNGEVDIDQGIYFLCEYEGEKQVLNSSGEKVLDGDIEMQSPYLGSVDENSPFFYEKYDDPSDDYLEHDLSLRFYNVKGVMLCDIDVLDLDSINNSEYYNGGIGIKDVELITDDRILVGLAGVLRQRDNVNEIQVFYNVSLYNLNGERLQEWDGLATEKQYVISESNRVVFAVADYWNDEYQYELFAVDENGNIEDLGDLNNQEKYYLSDMGVLHSTDEEQKETMSYTLGENGEYKLYKSNDTWKLEDSSGNALYDKRYYDCWHYENCFFLVNEDNQVCLINSKGQILLDYGIITSGGSYGTFENCEIDDENFKSDGNSACFEVKKGGENVLYVFFPNN